MQKIGEFSLAMKQYLLRDVLLNDGFLSSIGTFYTGLIDGDKVGLVDKAGYLAGVEAKCNPTYSTINGLTEDTWALKKVGIYKEWCEENVNAELLRNVALHNLTQDKAFMSIIKWQLQNALTDSALCLALFGDTTSSNASLQLCDGIIKKIIAYATDDTARKTDIATNTKSAMLSGDTAIVALENMLIDAPSKLMGASDKEIIMTQALWNAIAYNMKVNKGINIEAQWTALFGGLKETTWNGIRVVVIPALDEIIAGVTGNALSGKPYFALFTTKSNLCFGSRDTANAGVGKVDIWDNKDLNVTRAKVEYSMGTLVPQADMFQVLY